ncbi:MAG TPA: NAD(P)-dependent oxidoreductase [Steroidobacteraceae bacterium]|jgi:3-hydroxyisobutyrate dehydrogenase|nr:NAD(P)-dependent oxidoreductase [Steroidobacteraceae bacterium]
MERTLTTVKPRIGFIGLGVMGLPMARHLARAGYALTVLDINKEPVARLQAAVPQVSVASTPAAVASASDIVVTMLPSGLEVREIALGARGLVHGFKPGGLLLDTSSSEPEFTKEIAEGLAKAGISTVDAPVSGAEAGAISAELVFMVGGDTESVARVTPLLRVLGRQMFHLGPVGSGHAMKSINNLITSITFLATAEGLVMGKAYGLDPAVMNDVLNESTGMSWISRMHIPQRVLTRRFDDPFKFDLMVKDINIALRLAAELKLNLPLSETAQTLWRATQARIAKGSSVSELVRSLEQQTGVELTSPSVEVNRELQPLRD